MYCPRLLQVCKPNTNSFKTALVCRETIGNHCKCYLANLSARTLLGNISENIRITKNVPNNIQRFPPTLCLKKIVYIEFEKNKGLCFRQRPRECIDVMPAQPL